MMFIVNKGEDKFIITEDEESYRIVRIVKDLVHTEYVCKKKQFGSFNTIVGFIMSVL